MTTTSAETIKCAPSKNLNTAYPHFATAKEMYAHLREITQPGGEYVVRNFVGVIEDISPTASLVETELFPAGALLYYTKAGFMRLLGEEAFELVSFPSSLTLQGTICHIDNRKTWVGNIHRKSTTRGNWQSVAANREITEMECPKRLPMLSIASKRNR